LKVALGRALIALVTKIVSPQTIGLECASPGIGVRHRMFSPVEGFQVSGRFCFSEFPDASRPRSDLPQRRLRRAGRADDSTSRASGHDAGWKPAAAIEDHLPHPAFISDCIEAELRAVAAHGVASGGAAFFRARLILQQELAAGECPRARHGRPSFAAQ
jgi:hypothetical protein